MPFLSSKRKWLERVCEIQAGVGVILVLPLGAKGRVWAVSYYRIHQSG